MSTPKSIRDDAVFLIDGSGYIFRAYYAVRPLSSSKGVPTNAVYGFTSMLIKLLREHKPRYLAIAFDTGKPTFRHEMYAAYKGNRPPPPEDLIPQFDLIHRVVDGFRIKRLVKEGFEADDLIGTVTKTARAQGHQVVIVTGDKDFMQLVDADVFLLDELRASKNGTELLIDREQVIQKFGVPPEHVVDVLALAGDSSDNVPGVRGVGEKTATELVQNYGSVESILNAAPLMTQKARRERLIEGHEMALLSKTLVTIDCDVPIDLDWAHMQNPGPDKAALQAFFHELDFKRWAQDPNFLNGTGHAAEEESAPQAKAPTPSSDIDRSRYTAVITPEELARVVQAIGSSARLAIDTETDSLDPIRANLVGISLSWAKGEAVYIPLGHDFAAAPRQLSVQTVIDALAPLLADPARTIVAQNAKYDRHVLQNAGFAPFHIGGDPMLASYLLEADNARHGLDDLSVAHLGHENIHFEDVCGKGKTQIPFSAVPLERAVAYAAEDADVAFRLAEILEPRLQAEGLEELYRNLELPLEEVLAQMERHGVRIDTKRLQGMSQEFAQKLSQIEKESHVLAGAEFNLASPKQVSDVLFGKLGLEPVRKTKTGQSTDSEVLEELAPLHPLPKLLLEHRLISKLKGTYIDTLPKLVNPRTGRVHTSFNQAVAATGRLSSSDPNLQNIPIRSPEGRRIREAFVADEGKVLISLDYSQIELRILAAVSRDPVMLDAFNKGEDVHQRTASEVFDVPLNAVTKEQRSYAKTINFGLIYGMGVHRLSQTLGISRADASTYLNRYYERYAGIYNWQKNALEKAKKDLEVRTLFGRRRKIPEIRSQNKMLVQRAERVAINTPIQGTAADVIKRAMIETQNTLEKKLPTVHLLLQVHDELLLEAPHSLADEAAEIVREIMCKACDLSVPIVVDCGQGHSWADAH